MSAAASVNYMPTSNAAGTFNITSKGWVQGMFVDDPAVRNQLAGGVVGPNEIYPMWGGIAINDTVTPNGAAGTTADSTLGGFVTRATNVTPGAAGQITGFTTFMQAYHMAISTGAPVPTAGSYMSINYFRLGSRARIVVACTANIAALETLSTSSLISWDFVNQQVMPYVPAYAQQNVSSATYNSGTGALALTFATAPFGATYTGLGSNITLSGFPTAGVDGTFPITAIASAGTVVTVQAPTGLGTPTLTGGVLAAGGGALPARLLDVEVGTSMQVVYNSVTNVATWNRAGTVALIELGTQ